MNRIELSTPPMNLPEGSVTQCIARFRAGDRDAFDKIWEHYFAALIKIARKQLNSRRPGGIVDEDDIVQNALMSVCRGLPHNQSYEGVASRENLWPILVAITKYKVSDYFRHEGAQKRGGGRVFNQSAGAAGDDSSESLPELLADDAPTSDDLATMSEQLKCLMDLLPKDDLRRIARLHLEGWKNAEIAEKAGISLRGVERKLALIRDTWYEWWRRQEE
jgi:RNA polymerase sigma factor (sigma-70 family)